MKDCAWCGMPMEVVKCWTRKTTKQLNNGTKRVEEPYITARCLLDHWYGGPEDMMVEDDL